MKLDYINHYNAVRLRVTGSGSLDLKLLGWAEQDTQTLTSQTMSLTSKNPVTALANLKGAAVKLRISTDQIDEVFNISQIQIYHKPVESSLPQ